ncbi:MAG: hypothetical protein NT062_08780 [Proteobacteria bacterium]|nr:hypothetical protein [Pseudomonadota bacterium]
MVGRAVIAGWLLGVAGCPASETPIVKLAPITTTSGNMRVRVFTEPAPVRSATAVGKYTFVATDNELARWDDKGEAVSGMVSGTRVVALAPENAHAKVWILTDVGLGYYDVATEVFTELLPPPPAIGVDYAQLAKDGASLAPAGDGGVWLGTSHGLIYASAQGGWTRTPITDPVRALWRDRVGYLWIAARGGMLARKPTGETVQVTDKEGCAIVDPRIVIGLSGDRMLVIGADDQGHERLAIGKQLNWVTYRALPAVKFEAATARGDAAIVMGGGRAYRISTDEHTVKPLARDTIRLVALVGTPPVDWTIEPTALTLPAGATSLSVADDQLLVGTRDLGVARYRQGDTQPFGWLRRKQMVADAMTLTVGCARIDDCWIATGTRNAWHWNGDRFVPGGPDQVALAIVRDPTTGTIYALHRGVDEPAIRLSRIEGTTWTPVAKVAITTPGEAPEISFARVGPSGTLWLGLRYRDGLERRPAGLAIVEPATGKVRYSPGPPGDPGDSKADKKLPIPIGVLDADVRGDVAWFATNEGVARLAAGKVALWTEADGLRSELARAITIGAAGEIVVATGAGAGIFDGKAWTFPPALRFEINDVIAARNGQIWMGTERGIAAWDGTKVRRVDMRRGLAENVVLDLATDQFDRVWARGPNSLTLISQ